MKRFFDRVADFGGRMLLYCKEALMSFRQFSALSILKGRLECCFKKCRFSDISASAPVHSTYAAIKASAGFSPCNSYLDPSSKGTTKSSSTTARFSINPTNSENSAGDRLRLTSSVISRGMLIECKGYTSVIRLKSASQAGFLKAPNPKIYSFESRTRSNFFLPDFFSCFTKGFYCLFFCHFGKRMFSLGDKLAQFDSVKNISHFHQMT